MAIDGKVEKFKRLKDIFLGQTFFAPDAALLADTHNNIYVCADVPVSDSPDRYDISVTRYGKGLGEFNFSCEKRPIVVMMHEDPVYNLPNPYDTLSDGLLLIVPMGFPGSVMDYVKKFFPGEFEEYKEDLDEYREYKRDATAREDGQLEVSLKCAFPKTYGLREKLYSLAKADKFPVKKVSELIKKCEKSGEGLSREELQRIFSL